MERTKTRAGLFALLLGFLGVHRFWLLRPASGLLYLLPAYAFLVTYFTWALNPPEGFGAGHRSLAAVALVGLAVLVLASWVEAVRFFTMHPTRFRQKHISDAPVVSDPTGGREHVRYDTHKRKGTAVLLAFLLGWVGAQRFYIGRPGSAVGWLLLALTGLAAVVVGLAVPLEGGLEHLWILGVALLAIAFLAGWIDAFRLVAMKERLFRYRYGHPVEG